MKLLYDITRTGPRVAVLHIYPKTSGREPIASERDTALLMTDLALWLTEKS